MREKELRELDAWLVEHAMGWKLARRFEGDGLIISDGGPKWLVHFRPTIDRATAMDVLERCGKKEVFGTQFVCLRFSPPGTSTLSNRGHWTVGRIKDGHWDGELGQAETMELAICLYARKLFA